MKTKFKNLLKNIGEAVLSTAVDAAVQKVSHKRYDPKKGHSLGNRCHRCD